MAKQRTLPAPAEINPLVHERLRLGILCALTVQESLTFPALRDLMETTDGNLSVQARKLEDAGYITCVKKFVARRPSTSYKLTGRGRTALRDYVETLSAILPPASSRTAASGRLSSRLVPTEA